MGFPKDPTKYPAEFAALYRKALVGPFEIDLGDRGMAVSYCHRLHAYRRAVEFVRPETAVGMRDITLSARGTRVIFRSNEAAMAVIREAVGIVEPTTEELDEYLAKLEQGMKEHDRPIRDTDSREQPIYSEQEKGAGQVETDYLKLFKTTEDSKEEDSAGSDKGEI